MVLDQEVFVSGLVDESGDLFIWFEEMVGKGIKLFPVIFIDNDGKWCLNLQYAKPNLGHNHFLHQENSDYRIVLTVGENGISLKYRINNYNKIESFDPELRVGVIIF